ncbi:MAG: peptide ABC transporter substrate-binding protein [Spirochaetota bacterium]|nr:peptide ABC transporter substrate-binding protein [Spirochaetota bacterium]
MKSLKVKLILIFGIFYFAVIVISILSILHKPDQGKKHLQILMKQEPDDLNPITGSMSAASEIEGAIFRPMVYIDRQGNPQPVLVDSIPTVKNGGVTLLDNKGMKVIWKFKENLVWEDGQPLGPSDVIFTYNVIMNKNVKVPSRDLEKRIERMEVDPRNPRHLIVYWKETYATYFKGHPIVPKHILEKDYLNDPAKLHLSGFSQKPVGNGPFRLAEWKLGNYVYLVRNENFPPNVGKKPYFNSISYRFVSETTSMLVAVHSEFTDALSPVGPTFDQAVDFKKRYGHLFNVYIVDGIIWEHIDINLDDPILKDQRVRAALMYAMKRKTLVKHIFDNKLDVAHSWLPPLHPGYYKDIKKYKYSPKKAVQLLEEAGWFLNDEEDEYRSRIPYKIDGKIFNEEILREITDVKQKQYILKHYRYDKKRQRYYLKDNLSSSSFQKVTNILQSVDFDDFDELKITLLTTKGDRLRELIQTSLREDLKKVGIDLVIDKNQYATTLFDDTLTKRKFQLLMYAWSFSPTFDGENLWTISNIPSEKNMWVGSNSIGYRNLFVDKLHQKIPRTIDENKRKEYFKLQQDHWINDIPAIPLYFRKELSITRPDLMNWKPQGTDTPVTWNCEEWYIKK